MNTNLHLPPDEQVLHTHAYARRVVARLDEGTSALPYDISERLRASREQALAKRKKEILVHTHQPATLVVPSGGAAALGGWRSEGGGWWQSLLGAIPMMALVVGLVVINTAQDEYGLAEVVEVDAALLTDDLPPEAYADPGFVQFLKNGGSQQSY